MEGKICIEKMMSFMGDVVRFFLNPFFFAITWPSLIQIELFKILGKLDF